jgi:phage major head subunit gpT-like protein
MAITQSDAGFVSDETVSVFALDKFTVASPRMPSLFNQQGSNNYREVMGSMSGLSSFTAKTDLAGPDLDEPVQQFKKEFDHEEYAKGLEVERKVYDDQKFAFLQRLGGMLGLSALRTFEEQAAAVFNEAFASSTYTSEDALSLCNNAHLNVDGGNSQDNAGSTALGYDAVGTTMTAMRKFTDYRGKKIMVEPNLIVHPVDLDQTAFEIVRSKGDPTEANLKANYYAGKVSSLSWSYLTSTSYWFMCDTALMMENLFWFWKAVLEFFGDGDAWKGMRRIGAYFRSSHSAVDWRWIYGHAA